MDIASIIIAISISIYAISILFTINILEFIKTSFAKIYVFLYLIFYLLGGYIAILCVNIFDKYFINIIWEIMFPILAIISVVFFIKILKMRNIALNSHKMYSLNGGEIWIYSALGVGLILGFFNLSPFYPILYESKQFDMYYLFDALFSNIAALYLIGIIFSIGYLKTKTWYKIVLDKPIELDTNPYKGFDKYCFKAIILYHNDNFTCLKLKNYPAINISNQNIRETYRILD